MKRFLNKITVLIFFLFCALILVLSLRGIQGNPTSNNINDPKWKDEGPLELSPDRGRFALAMSIVEDNSLHFSIPLARFVTPDLGYQNGNYVSLFPPGVSYLIIPGYILGKMAGLAQVGSFAVIALFALANAFLVRAIAIHLKANSIAATIASLVFLFATPAFTYGVTLYQHHISTFIILLSLFVLLRANNFLSLSIVWLLFAATLSIDYPNIFLMLPIAIFALGKIIYIVNHEHEFSLDIKPLYIFTFITILFPLLFFFWFNTASYGNPFQLSGTLPTVKAIDELGKPTVPNSIGTEKIEELLNPEKQQKKAALGFFKTRNILNGFYILFTSPDRGILMYTPVVLFGIFGMGFLYKRNKKVTTLILAVIGMNILLYSVWDDAWGGWAFGSRYLIPSYALLAIMIAIFLTKFRKNTILSVLFFLVLAYSILINSLGALTTNSNPPQAEILALEKLSGKEEKYTYERNWDYLNNNNSKSFIWQTYAKYHMSAFGYYYIISSLLLLAGIILLVYLRYN